VTTCCFGLDLADSATALDFGLDLDLDLVDSASDLDFADSPTGLDPDFDLDLDLDPAAPRSRHCRR